jgi:phosphoribosylanthranilate isomerase
VIRVKICGLTRLEDALHAAHCGADALGFIVWPGSKRAVAPDAAREIIGKLPPFVTPVGVFVNETAQAMTEMAAYCGFRVIQLSGDEKPDITAGLALPVIKAFRSVPDLTQWHVAGYLADGAVDGQFGGTGTEAEDALIAALAPTGRLILAGGLTPDNVAARAGATRPYAIDTASGTEASPGIKDPDKVSRFIARVRSF